MDPLAASSVVFGLILAIGGIAAWRVSRRQNSFEATDKTSWRDDSLDDWRREREQQLEDERQQRARQTDDRLRTGQEEQQESQQKTHTRLGG